MHVYMHVYMEVILWCHSSEAFHLVFLRQWSLAGLELADLTRVAASKAQLSAHCCLVAWGSQVCYTCFVLSMF